MLKHLYYLNDKKEIQESSAYITIPIKTGCYASPEEVSITYEELNGSILNLFLESRIYPYTIVYFANTNITVPKTLFFESKNLCELLKTKYKSIFIDMNTPEKIVSLIDKYCTATTNTMVGLYSYYDRLKEIEINIVHNTVDAIKIDYFIFSYTEHNFSKLLALISYMSYDLLTEVVKINIKLSEMKYDLIYKTKDDSIIEYILNFNDLIDSYNRMINNITYYSRLQVLTYEFTSDYNELYTFLLNEYNIIKSYLETLSKNEKKRLEEIENMDDKSIHI